MSDKYYHVIGKEGCPWCVKAESLLESHGIDYVYYDYTGTEKHSWDYLTMKTHGLKTVPQIFDENYELIGGYDQLDGYLNGNYKS